MESISNIGAQFRQYRSSPKVIYVEDHEVTRLGTQCVLKQFDPNMVIIEAPTYAHLVEYREIHSDADLLLLDLGLPDVNGLVSIPAVREMYPTTPVVVMTAHDCAELVLEAMQHGAAGYIIKTTSLPTIIHALELVLDGQVFFPRHILDQLCHASSMTSHTGVDISMRHGQQTDHSSTAALAAALDSKEWENGCGRQLTRRQCEVVRLVALGLANKDIARALNISLGTAKNHVAEILRLLNCTNRRELIYKVFSNNADPS